VASIICIAGTPTESFHHFFKAPRGASLFLDVTLFRYTVDAMYFTPFQTLALCAFAMQSGLSNAESNEKAPPVPCTGHSPTTGSFYDLRPISRTVSDHDKRSSKNAKIESWQAKGYDFNANFTMNICGPVVEKVKDVVGLESKHWQNVSAFYTKDGETYSIGWVNQSQDERLQTNLNIN
jgi:hypothetical protein